VIRRVLATLCLALGALVVLGTPAQAQYEGPCGFVLGQSSVDLENGTVQVLGAGFEPGSEVSFQINGVFLGTTTAGTDPDGPIDATFPLPSGLSDGEYIITTTCQGTQVSQSIIVGNLGAACQLSVFTNGQFAEITLPGFDVGSQIDVSLQTHGATLYAGPVTGNPMTVGVTFPTNVTAGEYQIVAEGSNILGQPFTLTCPITAQVADTGLPVTGSDGTMGLVRIGLVLLTAGGLLFVGLRRRATA
jgi:hypothetical protein